MFRHAEGVRKEKTLSNVKIKYNTFRRYEWQNKATKNLTIILYKMERGKRGGGRDRGGAAVCGHSLAGIAGSNRTQGLALRHLCLLCVVKVAVPATTCHSSRGALPCVCLSVCVSNYVCASVCV